MCRPSCIGIGLVWTAARCPQSGFSQGGFPTYGALVLYRALGSQVRALRGGRRRDPTPRAGARCMRPCRLPPVITHRDTLKVKYAHSCYIGLFTSTKCACDRRRPPFWRSRTGHRCVVCAWFEPHGRAPGPGMCVCVGSTVIYINSTNTVTDHTVLISVLQLRTVYAIPHAPVQSSAPRSRRLHVCLLAHPTTAA